MTCHVGPQGGKTHLSVGTFNSHVEAQYNQKGGQKCADLCSEDRAN